MPEIFYVEDIPVELVRKSIKNMHLRVYPDGAVRVSAPRRMSASAVRDFVASKLDWVVAQRKRLAGREAPAAPEYRDGEAHALWGRFYALELRERAAAPAVRLEGGNLVLTARPGAGAAKRAKILDEWRRDLLLPEALRLMALWEPRLGVACAGLSLRRMRSVWGSCSVRKGTIRLNTELAKKPPECLEYVVVHELAHLIEKSHGPRFKAVLDRHLPDWKNRKLLLNRAPQGMGTAPSGDTDEDGEPDGD